jgi:hypothetical protein
LHNNDFEFFYWRSVEVGPIPYKRIYCIDNKWCNFYYFDQTVNKQYYSWTEELTEEEHFFLSRFSIQEAEFIKHSSWSKQFFLEKHGAELEETLKLIKDYMKGIVRGPEECNQCDFWESQGEEFEKEQKEREEEIGLEKIKKIDCLIESWKLWNDPRANKFVTELKIERERERERAEIYRNKQLVIYDDPTKVTSAQKKEQESYKKIWFILILISIIIVIWIRKKFKTCKKVRKMKTKTSFC